MKFLCPLGRLLFSLIFITAVPRHFSHEGIQHAAALGVPAAGVLVPLSGILAVVGGLSVAVGYKTRGGAWMLVAFLIPVTWCMHGYWRLSDPAAIHVQQAMFAKNLSMLGAALLVSQFGSGPGSIDEKKEGLTKFQNGAASWVSRGRASLRRRPMWITAGSALALILILLCGGFLGAVGSATRNTNYRSAVGAQGSYKVISLTGVAITYTDSGGTGPILICLHAIGHGARDFEDLSRRLNPQYRVLALDFPGQGNSGPDTVPASATRYAELLGRVIEQLDLKSVTLLGNSIGGAAAIRYASAHPERIKALVLCDTGGLGKPSPVARLFIGGFVQFFAAGRRGASWYPWAFDRYYRKVLISDCSREERDRIIRSAYEIAPILEQAWRSFGRPEENLLPLLPRIRCPVLLAWAKQDFVLPLKYAQPSFDQLKDHRLEIFDGGHAAFLEDPDRFERSLRTFLSTVPDRQKNLPGIPESIKRPRVNLQSQGFAGPIRRQICGDSDNSPR